MAGLHRNLDAHAEWIDNLRLKMVLVQLSVAPWLVTTVTHTSPLLYEIPLACHDSLSILYVYECCQSHLPVMF